MRVYLLLSVNFSLIYRSATSYVRKKEIGRIDRRRHLLLSNVHGVVEMQKAGKRQIDVAEQLGTS